MALRIAYISLAAALLSIVVIDPTTLFPFTSSKAFWFRVSISAALMGFLYWVGFQASSEVVRERFRKLFSSPIVKAVSIFVAVYLVAVFFAHDSASAFWSNFERSEGGFQMIYYYLFFLLLVLIVQSERSWRSLLVMMVATAALAIGYGIIAAIGGTPEEGRIFFSGPKGIEGIVNKRFLGALGNAAAMGSYLLFSLFFVSLLASYKDSFACQKWVLWGLGVLFLLFLLFTQTRGAFTGLMAGASALLVFYAWHMPEVRRRIAVGITVLFIVVSGAIYFQETRLIKETPIIGRLARISLEDRSIQTRIWVWEAALKGWQERPMLGWGPENFSHVFDKHFDTRHFVPGEVSETWYSKAHNIALGYLVETGIIGFLAFVGMFVIFYWQLFSYIRKSTGQKGDTGSGHSTQQKTMFRNALFFAFPIAYITQGLLFFGVLATYLPLFFFFAFAAYQFNVKPNSPR